MFDHYLAVARAGPDLPVPALSVELPPRHGASNCGTCWFRYSGDHPWILRDVDLHIRHGGALALIGLNSAGKSTLVKLLCRLYDLDRGAILWDGMDIREAANALSRRRNVACWEENDQRP